MSFEAGKKNQILKQLEEHDNEMTFMEATSDEIHNNLENILDFQTHYRMVSDSFDVINTLEVCFIQILVLSHFR